MGKMISADEAAARLGVTAIRVRVLCRERRIKGARLVGRTWMIPGDFSVTPGARGPAPTSKRRTGAAGDSPPESTGDLRAELAALAMEAGSGVSKKRLAEIRKRLAELNGINRAVVKRISQAIAAGARPAEKTRQ